MDDDEGDWKQTVKDIYDALHFGEDNIFTGNALAKRLIAFVEERHHGYFCEPHEFIVIDNDVV